MAVMGVRQRDAEQKVTGQIPYALNVALPEHGLRPLRAEPICSRADRHDRRIAGRGAAGCGVCADAR